MKGESRQREEHGGRQRYQQAEAGGVGVCYGQGGDAGGAVRGRPQGTLQKAENWVPPASVHCGFQRESLQKKKDARSRQEGGDIHFQSLCGRVGVTLSPRGMIKSVSPFSVKIEKTVPSLKKQILLALDTLYRGPGSGSLPAWVPIPASGVPLCVVWGS